MWFIEEGHSFDIHHKPRLDLGQKPVWDSQFKCIDRARRPVFRDSAQTNVPRPSAAQQSRVVVRASAVWLAYTLVDVRWAARCSVLSSSLGGAPVSSRASRVLPVGRPVWQRPYCCHTPSPPSTKRVVCSHSDCWCFGSGRFWENRPRVGCSALQRAFVSVEYETSSSCPQQAWTITTTPLLTDRIWGTSWQESLGGEFWSQFWVGGARSQKPVLSQVRRKQEGEVEMEPGQVELSSLLGWLRTFSLQSQVGGH